MEKFVLKKADILVNVGKVSKWCLEKLEKKKKKEGRFLAFSGRFWVVFHGEVRC